jgi:(S)-2-hydroxyglutarate dehydrogenase
MKFDVAIVGGGIVGLSSAYALLKKKPEINLILLEKENEVSAHQTGNNSGVIHSGIYYKPGSAKAVNCIKGYHMLIDFCKAHNIPYELCGKLIVATDQGELPGLEKLYDRGIENGLEGLKYLSQEELHEVEPYAAGIKAVFVPQTGIVDYKAMSMVLKAEILRMGGTIALGEEVTSINNGERVEITSSSRFVSAKVMINCAGLFCDKVAEMAGEKLDLKIIPFRGEYYYLKEEKKHMLKNLIYPVPDPNFPFLGVHFTRRITGEIEAGPNAVFAWKREGYKKTDFKLSDVLESISWSGFRKVALKYWKTGMGEYYRSYSKAAFVKALQKLMPSIQEEDLIPAGAGVRAQACHRDGSLIDDFFIQENGKTIHVLNAPSPAATSSLSIGDTLSDKVINILN